MTRAALLVLTFVLCGLPPLALGLAATAGVPGGLTTADLTTSAFTLALAVAASAIAGLLAIGPAWLMARGGVWLTIVAAAALATLALPEAATAYAIAEAWRQLFGAPMPLSFADHVRAVLSVSAGVWPLPAAATAVALSRVPSDVLDAARLDGVAARTTLRLAAGPWLAGVGGALLLAGRNVVAYDLTGIVTTGVLVRDRFNLTAGDDRLASALAAAAPTAIGLAVAAVVALWAFTRSVDALRSGVELDDAPTDLRRRRGLLAGVLASLPLGLCLVAGVVALARTAGGVSVAEFAPQLWHGIVIAIVAVAWTLAPTVLGTAARPRLAVGLAIAAFLVGGQLMALGLVALLADRPPNEALAAVQGVGYDLLYDSPIWFAWGPAALFAFLPIAASAATWRGRMASLRETAAVDGASAWQVARHVVWPTVWPGLAGALAATFALSLGETQAAVLLAPDTLVNYMMGNVHTLAYGSMARAALLGAGVAAAASIVAVGVWRLGRRVLALAVVAGMATVLVGCDGPEDQPEAVWLDRGSGGGQVVYPRAITYSPAEDVFWVIDRTARVQKFDAATGDYVLGWDMPQNQYGKPVGVSVDDEGNVWVPDTHYHRVIVYSPTGDELFRFGQTGENPGDFIWPTDILVLDHDRVLVGEYGVGETGDHDRIQLFERGEDDAWTVRAQIGSFGTGEGQFRRPQSMARVGDELWVCDATNHRLLAFSLKDADFGVYVRELGKGEASSEPGGFRFPYGLDVDGHGHLVVAEFGNNRVQVVDPATGACVGTWGAFGGRAGELKYPWAIAYDAERDHCLIVDSGNDRVQVVALP